MFLEEEFTHIENYISHFEKTNTKVSKKSVGWQLDHSLRILIGVPRVLEKSDALTYKKNINKTRTLVFMLNKIPRGKYSAAKKVVNTAPIQLAQLSKMLKMAKEEVKKTANLAPNANFDHPYFGQLNLKQTKKFLKIHTKHHLKIIEDILA
jgi:paraquat-inducible protein B